MSLSKTLRNELGKPGKRINVDFKTVGLILLYLITVFVNGISQYVSSEFDMAYVGTSEWWSNMFQRTATNLIILLATFLYLLDKALRKDQRVLDIKKDIENTVRGSLNPATFEPFIEELNLSRKIKRYTKVLNKRLDKLNDKAKLDDVKAWNTMCKLKAEGITELPKSVLENKFCFQKAELIEALKDSYIDKNIKTIPVKFNLITSNFVKNGYRKKSKDNEDDPYTTESGSWKFIRDIGPKFFLSFAWITAVNSIALEVLNDVNWKLAILGTFLAIVPMVMQIYIAGQYKEQYINEKILVDFMIRNDILIKYMEYKNKPKPPVTITEIPVTNTPIPIKEVAKNGDRQREVQLTFDL